MAVGWTSSHWARHPLILEKVPPNNWYGFRVAKTFSSESIWYAANRAAGYNLLWSGVAIAVTAAIVGLLFDRLGSTIAQTINLAVFIGALLVAVVRSFLYLNRL
ncbi:MAG: SdpI family protein [Pleurocapsa sp. MO_226.B13]|nr:SdpI family protein [Pleurocapsa sp. MO_226.B13]